MSHSDVFKCDVAISILIFRPMPETSSVHKFGVEGFYRRSIRRCKSWQVEAKHGRSSIAPVAWSGNLHAHGFKDKFRRARQSLGMKSRHRYRRKPCFQGRYLPTFLPRSDHPVAAATTIEGSPCMCEHWARACVLETCSGWTSTYKLRPGLSALSPVDTLPGLESIEINHNPSSIEVTITSDCRSTASSRSSD